MKSKILRSLGIRITSEINDSMQIKFLKTFNVEELYTIAVDIIFMRSRTNKVDDTALFSEVIHAIGERVNKAAKQKVNSAVAARVGAFTVFTFEECGLVRLKKGTGANGHGTYLLEVIDTDTLEKLWIALPSDSSCNYPHMKPFPSWEKAVREDRQLIKTANRKVLSITAETHPIVFDVVNRAQEVGWRINSKLLSIASWAFRNKQKAFNEIWEMHSPEAKASKVRETKTILGMATKLKSSIFYHAYYLDFRGRKYPATAYLHEQGSDLAKGLLLREDSKVIMKNGYFWLLVSIASNWGNDAGREDGQKTDKIPLVDRYEWVLDNEEIILSYAESPKVNTGWMRADKPWQFLAACTELMQLRIWQANEGLGFENYMYPSSLECYIDGSNNGAQHLSALTRDEKTAPHVNLVPADLPGDLYEYVAKAVWRDIDEQYNELHPHHIETAEAIISTLVNLKKQIHEAPVKTEERAALIDRLRSYRMAQHENMHAAAIVFWHAITDKKHRRKIVKRNIMTLPYGGTPYGLGQQQIDDARKHGIEALNYMEHKWGAFMGRVVFEVCKTALKRPMQLLSVFEQAGKNAELDARFLEWIVPLTNFPVVQNYTEGTVKKLHIQYGPPKGPRLSTGHYENTLQLHICHPELPEMAKHKQAQGAAPNIVHSLDAAHLMLTVYNCKFPVTTIHDSYGCLLGDMMDLFTEVRKAFVQLYEVDPLAAIAAQTMADLSTVEFGTLDINSVIESEYCFA